MQVDCEHPEGYADVDGTSVEDEMDAVAARLQAEAAAAVRSLRRQAARLVAPENQREPYAAMEQA